MSYMVQRVTLELRDELGGLHVAPTSRLLFRALELFVLESGIMKSFGPVIVSMHRVQSPTSRHTPPCISHVCRCPSPLALFRRIAQQ